jgi:hypothetical protein
VTPATPASITPYVELLTERYENGRVFALYSPEGYDGDRCIQLPGREVDVRWCPSELAMREALVDERSPERRLLLLTPVASVGADLAARLTPRHVVRANPTDALAAAFGAQHVDPLIPDWLVERLVSLRPANGYPRTGGRLLSADRAWDVYLERALGLDERRGLRGLLSWIASAYFRHFGDEPDAARAGVHGRLLATVPGAGGPLASLNAGHAAAVVALGLAVRVLVDAPEWASRAAARARMEVGLDGWSFDEAGARRWAATAEDLLVEQLISDMPAAQALLTEADRVLEELQAADLATHSRWLRSGLRARQAALGAALDSDGDLDGAVTAVEEHGLAGDGAAEVARLAGRMYHWLQTVDPAPASLLEAARRHAGSDAYADYARTLLRFGGEEARLDAALRRLVGRADERRVAEDGRFAELLAEWSTRSETTPELLGVEDVLGQLVAPLAAQRRVLVVVMDGMSHRVAVELVEDALRRGWTELRRGPQPERALVLSTLPSVTQFARASLLSGELRQALATEEAVAFSGLPGLRSADPGGPPPILFHKGALRHPQGGLADPVRDAIEGPGRIVGAVVNAIDDHLARSEQVRSLWSVRDVPLLSWLLTAGQEAERLVVLVADHGHVIERGGEMRARGGTGGERWASAERTPRAGEILIEGRRVLASDRRAVLCWDERVRFSPPKHGYHGGASPQEVLVPTVVLAPGVIDPPDGWAEAPYDPPAWWSGVETAPPAQARSEAQLSFDAADWIDELLTSDVLAEQRRRYPRPAVPDSMLRTVLAALDAAGATLLAPALAQAASVSPPRLRGLLAAMQLLLNVEGYQVLEFDDASGTVRLHRAVLAEQFGT